MSNTAFCCGRRDKTKSKQYRSALVSRDERRVSSLVEMSLSRPMVRASEVSGHNVESLVRGFFVMVYCPKSNVLRAVAYCQ